MAHYFDPHHAERDGGVVRFYGPPDWSRLGPTETITAVFADGIRLGPKPEGLEFPALKRLKTTWGRGIESWLRGSRLTELEIDRPTQATLDALDQVPLEFLRLQSGRWAGPLRWPRLEHLTELWFVLDKQVDLAGISTLPALRTVRIDAVKHLSNLGALGVGHRLGEIDLEDIREVEDPAQLWQINADKVRILSSPGISPWAVEALRSRPEPSTTPRTAFWFSDEFDHALEGDGALSAVSALRDSEDGASLTFDPLSLPTLEVLEEAGVDSTGDVWTDLIGRLWPELTRRLELDPETELFAAYGSQEDLHQLQAHLEPLLTDGDALTRALKGIPLNRLGA